jgi:hypothetical protein
MLNIYILTKRFEYQNGTHEKRDRFRSEQVYILLFGRNPLHHNHDSSYVVKCGHITEGPYRKESQ